MKGLHRNVFGTILILVACVLALPAQSSAQEATVAVSAEVAEPDSSPASTGPVADQTTDAVAGESSVRDPWQPFNRRVHNFNRGLDRYIAKPLARGYVAVTPRPIRSGVSNFFINLFQPLTAVHQLLQGKPGQAGSALGRFTLNVVLGLGGVLDPATDAGIPLRQEDLGQTLAVWGWKDSRYLVLPFFGPSTTRDGVGIVGDSFASPYQIPDDDEVKYGLRGLELIDTRANLLGAEEFIRDADDEYLIFRDAFLQRRHFMINDGRDETPDYLLEDFDFDDFDDAGDSSPDDSGRDGERSDDAELD